MAPWAGMEADRGPAMAAAVAVGWEATAVLASTRVLELAVAGPCSREEMRALMPRVQGDCTAGAREEISQRAAITHHVPEEEEGARDSAITPIYSEAPTTAAAGTMVAVAAVAAPTTISLL